MDADDAVAAIERLVEEATGVGIVKRVAQKIRLRVSREFIDRIDALTSRNNELTRTINSMGDAYQRLLEHLDAKDARIAELERELDARTRDESGDGPL